MRILPFVCALLCVVPANAFAAREKHLVRASAKIIGLDGIREAYEKGRGAFRTRATPR